VHRYGLALPVMFDEILRPTLKRIHDLFASGKLTAPEHQLAINALSTSTSLMIDAIVKPSLNGKKVICATTENESDDVLLKALTVLLEGEGYDVLNLGIGVSVDDVMQLAKTQKPHFVYLLASQTSRRNVSDEHLVNLAADLAAENSSLVLCGNGYMSENPDVKIHASFADLFGHAGTTARGVHARVKETVGQNL